MLLGSAYLLETVPNSSEIDRLLDPGEEEERLLAAALPDDQVSENEVAQRPLQGHKEPEAIQFGEHGRPIEAHAFRVLLQPRPVQRRYDAQPATVDQGAGTQTLAVRLQLQLSPIGELLRHQQLQQEEYGPDEDDDGR